MTYNRLGSGGDYAAVTVSWVYNTISISSKNNTSVTIYEPGHGVVNKGLYMAIGL